MKRYILTFIIIANALTAQAQSRKSISNFSSFQQYYNPALTGHEGSMLKTFYRNQWTGFEGAPKTMFFSAEIDLKDLSSWKKDDVQEITKEEYNKEVGVGHAVGLAVLQDQFGPFTENQVMLNYSSRVRLTEKLSLRIGAALHYDLLRLDGHKLVLEQDADLEYQEILGQHNKAGKVDINLGLTLTADQFYFGYAMQDVTKGEMLSSKENFMKGAYPLRHIVQAGYRLPISEKMGLIANGIYQSDKSLGTTIEGQLKVVYQNMFWLGGGYRNDLAYNFNGGIRIKQFKVGYAYEMPTGDAKFISENTNEIMITYNLFSFGSSKLGRSITMW